MSPKKRVYDLAKEYGMTGQELAAKLRDLGFQVKSHMSALDDFQVLEIRGRLEAYGIVGESSGQSVSTVGGLKIKRKKKKPATAEPAQAPAEEEPEEEPASQESEPAPESAAPSTEEAPDEPIPAEPVAEEAHEIVGVEADAATDETGPARELEEEAHAPIEEPTAAEESEVPEPTPAEAKASVEVEATEEPVADQELAPEAAAKETAVEGEKAPTKKGAEVVRPSTKRRTGKVVGFIDPSQFQTRPQRKSESRRLRSSDDVVPDVMPTFGRDRASGMVRGDTTRGALTAQQLREREAGRFLRRRRPQQQSGPGGRRHGGGRDASSTDSPFVGGVISIEAPITIKKLANTLAVKENQVMRVALQQLGLGININSGIDEESAILLANEFNVELSVKEEVEAEEALLLSLAEKRGEVEAEHIVTRPPTVAVLGHVDHGKTTLIDTIRRSRITHGEAGGITQHIGAYQIETKAGHVLTIVDTPGHEAFTSMRARGANAVDVVILIVAADDGVKPQTEEAYNHAKVAGAPIVVALNKIDKPEANTERVLNELAGLGLTPEEWGGETAMLQVSALKNEGVDELLERVFLESEVLELRSHPKGPARGVVLEAEIQQGKGKVAHLLVQDGSLNRGDVILAGEGYGKVRSIHDDHGKQIKEAGPSKPVEVTGLNELPMAGDMFHVVGSLDQAQEVAEERARKNRLLSQIERRSISTENLLEAVADQDKPTINLIIKADVQGSAEVLKNQISQLQHAEVDVRVLHSGVGAVLESDVDLAITSDARILAFHTQAQNKVRQAAERGNVEIKSYDVIYELLDDIRKLMEGELAPEIKEEVTGHVEIRRIFKSSRLGNIGGSYVLDGKIRRGSKIRLFRDDKLIHTGLIGSLRRESEDAKEVREGFECGVVLKDYNDIKEGDVVEAYRVYEVKRTL